jgi:hypothetical protein
MLRFFGDLYENRPWFSPGGSLRASKSAPGRFVALHLTYHTCSQQNVFASLRANLLKRLWIDHFSLPKEWTFFSVLMSS